jgi:hypothetical protein
MFGRSREAPGQPCLLSQHSRRDPERGAPRRRGILCGLSPRPLAALGADDRGRRDPAVHRHLERLSVRRHVLGAPGSAPVTVALNNLAGASFGARKYNVDMAGGLLTALPTLAVYLFWGRYFLRGLAAGAVKG